MKHPTYPTPDSRGRLANPADAAREEAAAPARVAVKTAVPNSRDMVHVAGRAREVAGEQRRRQAVAQE
jgi:hypothetical protein